MTTELAQKFYDTFGIEPISKKYKCKCGTSITLHNLETCKSKICDKKYCDQRQIGVYYPEITNKILLEMICIILNAEGLLTINTEGNITDIKDFVLRFLIGKVNKNNPYCHYKTKNKIKHQIQQLFKED